MLFRVPKAATGLLLAIALVASAGSVTAQSENLLQAIPTPWGFDICGASCSGFYCCLIIKYPGG